jgi:predicted negative regulator of RcsB-dependent stress response
MALSGILVVVDGAPISAMIRRFGSLNTIAMTWAATCASLLFACAATQAQAPSLPLTPPQTVHRAAFRAVSYDVSASLLPADQTLSAKATVEFEASEPSRTVECELHPNLRITAVRDATGKLLEFNRDDGNQLLLRISLPDSLSVGQRTKLTFDYSGPLASDENSPVNGLRLAWIGNSGAYLLLPARWFPLTGYPGNRYTGVFHIEVPQDFVVVGTGTPEGPSAVGAQNTSALSALPVRAQGDGNQNPSGGGSSSEGPPVLVRRGSGGATGPPPPPTNSKNPVSAAVASAPASPPSGSAATSSRVVYTFRADRPEAAGTFVAGPLQATPVKAEGISVSVYTPADASGTAQAYGEGVAHMVEVFSDQFGALAQPSFTLAQLPDGTVSSFAAPGLLLVSQHQWAAAPNQRLLSNLVAAQWWGDQVMAATPNDAWLTDGLARYSEAIYVEQTASREGMNKALEDFAVGALMYEEAAPIAEAGRLAPFSPTYASIVANKGAIVFHMLRAQLGDDAFFSLLRDFFSQFSGKTATLNDFRNLAQARADKLSAPAPDAASPGYALGNAAPSGASSAEAHGTNLRPFFTQWLNSTGVPEFTLNYTVYRIKSGFKVIGKVKQNLDFFRAPVEVEIRTEGNPEHKTIQVTGLESDFDFEVFGRPRSDGIILDPRDTILKSSQRLRVRAIIARGEAFAELGRYYDAIQQYSQALEADKSNALADFRMGEAFFYQKNYSASANAFRDTLDGDIDPSYKWVEVWSHIYLGKIYDLSGDRARAVNEYSKAQQTNDDTGGAQAESKKYLAQPYAEASL